MLDFGFYLMDCMEGMKEFPDKYFDLAIVDPPYGEKVGKGGYMHNTVTGGVAKRRNYHTNVFFQEKPDAEYFAELQRVSKNQIVWGGIILLIFSRQVSAGLCGTRSTRKQSTMRTVNLHGLHLTGHQEYSVSCGMECCRKI